MPDRSLAIASWCFMVTALTQAFPASVPDAAPSFTNMYGWKGTPPAYVFSAILWTLSLSVFVYANEPTAWTFGIAFLDAWLAHAVLASQTITPHWAYRIVIPVLAGYLGLIMGAYTSGTNLAHSFFRGIERVPRPRIVGPVLLLGAGWLYYAWSLNCFIFDHPLIIRAVVTVMWTVGFGIVHSSLPTQWWKSVFTTLLLADMAVVWMTLILLEENLDTDLDIIIRIADTRWMGVMGYVFLVAAVAAFELMNERGDEGRKGGILKI